MDRRHSALHLAVEEGNNRSIDCILTNMSKIDRNCSRQFRAIFDQLIEYKQIKTYLEFLPAVTVQMKRKQVLKVSEPLSKEIIAMKESSTVYVDETFYQEEMGEDETGDNISYPVKVVALRLGWMLQSQSAHDGYKFLKEINTSEDLTFYNLGSLRIITEFLYQRIKWHIMSILLPIYLCTIVTFFALALINENLRLTFK